MDKKFFTTNREKLIKKIDNNSVLLMFAGDAPYKSADEKYRFAPNRNFYYLTGIDREKVILMIYKSNDKVKETLFIERRDPQMARWVGEKISVEEAKQASGIKNIEYIDKFENNFGTALNRMGIDKLYLDFERQEYNIPMTYAQRFAKETMGKYPYLTINNIYNSIAELRIIKSEEEIELIRKAIAITYEGIENIMKHSKPDMMEYELEAFFDYTLTKNGVREKAFQTIAASGKNGTILHYSDNNCKAEDGNLILFDVGAQYKYYNGDISRTFPVNGKFTERQKQVYNVVLKAMKAVEKVVKPGVPFKILNEIAKKVLGEGCKQLGLIKEDSELSKYYFHGVSHQLGADAHDVGSGDIELKPGMVFTNEPGLYIEEEGIGIRIEDDLLVTEDGCENLSKDIIREIEDIEEFMKKEQYTHK